MLDELRADSVTVTACLHHEGECGVSGVAEAQPQVAVMEASMAACVVRCAACWEGGEVADAVNANGGKGADRGNRCLRQETEWCSGAGDSGGGVATPQQEEAECGSGGVAASQQGEAECGGGGVASPQQEAMMH